MQNLRTVRPGLLHGATVGRTCAALAGSGALLSLLFIATAAWLNAAPPLVAAYDFNQGSGTTLLDVSGNNNHGALTNGPVWTAAGKYGGALTFDGTNDMVSVADAASLDLTTGMTVEAWVRPATVSGWRTVVLKEIPGSLGYGMYSSQSGRRPSGEARIGSNVYDVDGNRTLSTGVWTHLATTYDGSVLRFYINGALTDSRSVAGSILTSSGPLRIGGNLVWGEYFRGQIDDVRIYSGALTRTQIQFDMATPVAPPPGDTLPPSVTLIAPAEGSLLSGPVTLSALASDNVGVSSVQFTLDGAALGSADPTSPYSVNWDTRGASNGGHTLAATATDAAGQSTSHAVTVVVDNAPQLVINQPAGGTTISGTTVNITYITAGDMAGVAGPRFQLDGGPDIVDATPDGAHQLTDVPAGAHVLTGFLAEADGSKVAGSDAAPVSFSTTTPDTTPPSVALTGPAEGARVEGGVVVTATATDDIGVSAVEFRYGGTLIGAADIASPYLVTWDTTGVSNGAHVLTAIARDAAGNATTSDGVTVTVANETRVPLGTLNGRTVFGDSTNRILSWMTPQDSAYDRAAATAWDFLLNRVPNDRNGLKAYFTNSYLNSGSLTPSGWMHNPAHLYAAVIDSALAYYAYSGDSRVITLARSMADYHLAHGLTPANWAWPRVPYASGCGNCPTYDGTGTLDSAGHIQPDKVGEFGIGLIRLYEFTGDISYRDTAIASANALALHIRAGNATQSPWPFRVNAQNNVAREEYTANVIRPIGLFDELIRLNLGDVASYRAARTVALSWLFAYPMKTNVWVNYFEDVDVQPSLTNYNQYIPMETAYYLMQHPEVDPEWRTHVPALLAWVETVLGQPEFGAMAINEQEVFRFVMGSHTSRYGAVNALWYELTGDSAARDKAYRALNWATYMISASPQGQIIDGPSVNNVWFTDGYGDYIRHFLRGMGAVPEWAPTGESHLTRSTSIVTAINYSASEITYTTAESNATDILKLAFTPVEVAADGVLLERRTDLDAAGWIYDAATRVLKVRHTQATTIRISDRSDTDAPVITSITSSGVLDNTATISWTTNEAADSQVEYGETVSYGSVTPFDGPYGTSDRAVITGLQPATVYHYRVRSRDKAGNVAESGDLTFATMAAPDTTPPAVAVTAPAGGSTVSGLVTVAADASDNVGVSSVEFLLDGASLGTANFTAPYSVVWNTLDTPNGTHVVSARAVDAAGGVATSAAVTVTVSNPILNVITFDDLADTRSLNGQYPTGLVDWGTNLWFVSAPWGQFTTNSISFSSSRTSASLTFVSPKRLISVRAFNGGGTSSTVTLSCSGNPTKTVSVPSNQLATITTGWTASCSTVTVASSNGWDTNFDDLTYEGP